MDIRSARLTPRVREAALLAQEGLSQVEIAERMGTTVACARVHLSYARKHGFAIPNLKVAPGYLAAWLTRGERAQFLSAAEDRKMFPNELVTRLLRNIVNDDLFNAILEK